MRMEETFYASVDIFFVFGIHHVFASIIYFFPIAHIIIDTSFIDIYRIFAISQLL